MTFKTETMYRMEAMRAAGLQPDMTVTNDTLVLGFNGSRLVPSQKWLDLYNNNIAVRLAYDQAKYGRNQPEDKSGAAHRTPPTITPRPEDIVQYREPFIDVTPIPKEHREPLSRAVLIATARGEARTLDVKDEYIAWLLEQMADALEAAVDPDDATNLED